MGSEQKWARDTLPLVLASKIRILISFLGHASVRQQQQIKKATNLVSAELK